jgi:hypothetical protein
MTNPLNDEYIALLAEEGNGAVETHLPEKKPLLVVLIGPIKTWWGRIDSEEYKEYALWRDAVRVALIHEGHLVYSPHRAWQGAWHEKAQDVNDEAIVQSDVVISLTPPGVVSVGTDAEIVVAAGLGKTVVYAPPGGSDELRVYLDEVEAARK